MNKKRILLITTSSGLPRLYPEYVPFENTWTSRLREKGDVLQLSLGGFTVDSIYALLHYYVHFDPDVVITQVGLADSALRPFSRIENRLLDMTPLTKRLKKWILKKYMAKLRKYRKITNLKPAKFAHYFSAMVKSFPRAEFYALAIAPPNAMHEERSPGLKKSIEKYNAIMQQITGKQFIPLTDYPDNGLMSDMHINNIGHEYIVQQIEEKVFMSLSEKLSHS